MVLVALIGLVSGTIGSLVAPWVNWGIEKRRLKLERRAKQIVEWRQFIEQFDFSKENFRATTTYAAMRPFMEVESRKLFEAQRTYFVPPDGVSDVDLHKLAASDEVSKIERKWELV